VNVLVVNTGEADVQTLQARHQGHQQEVEKSKNKEKEFFQKRQKSARLFAPTLEQWPSQLPDPGSKKGGTLKPLRPSTQQQHILRELVTAFRPNTN
jgi:hypothetical protein